MEFKHISVMLKETIDSLDIKPGGAYIDATMGGAGHTREILKRLDTGRLLSIDKDPDAIENAKMTLAGRKNITVAQGDFADIQKISEENGFSKVDGILMDIGVSSYQLDNPERGFSYHSNAPLDMRMSKEGMSAGDIIATFNEKQLSEIFYRYGEEKYAVSIARAIVRARETEPIVTTLELAEIIKVAVPAKVRRESHPARKVFQALRIAVNAELESLEEALEEGLDILNIGGRLAVITFHSLEDRIVKQMMNSWCTGCICPKDFPICICGKKPQGRLIFKKGLAPSSEEIEKNPRSRSARLRVFEKIC